MSVLTREEIAQFNAQSALDALKMLPGIEFSSSGTKAHATSIYIRGTSARHTLLLVDGVRVNSPTLGGADAIGLIPVNAIERIEVVRGPRAAVYGSDAIGGVIHITTVPASGSVHSAQLAVGSHGYNQQSWRSVGDISDNTTGSIVLANERSSGYRVTTAAPKDDRHGYNAQTLIGNLNHQASTELSLFFTGFYQASLVEYNGSDVSNGYAPTKFESDGDTYTFAGGVNYQKSQWNSNLQLSRSKDLNADGIADGGKSGKGSLTTRRDSVAWVNTYQGIANSLINLGVDYYVEHAERGGTNTVDFSEDRKTNSALFATGFSQLTDDLSLEASIRGDKDSAFGSYTTWNLAAGYALTDNIDVMGSYGTAFKAPTFNDLYYPGGSGNPDLKPEKSESAEIGIKGYTPAIIWSLTAYQTEIKDMIAWAPTSAGPWRPSNINNANITGVELELTFDTGPITHKLVGDWKDPKDSDSGEQLIRRAKENYKWTASYSTDKLDALISANYVGKRFDSGDYLLNAYATIDAAITYRVTQNLLSGLRISNLTDKEYETAKGYLPPERSWYLNAAYHF
jgi:vitamin B12 transporter